MLRHGGPGFRWRRDLATWAQAPPFAADEITPLYLAPHNAAFTDTRRISRMSRWTRPRRPSMKPVNIRRRLTNRVMGIIAGLVVAALYAGWNRLTAPDAVEVDARPAVVGAASAGQYGDDDGSARIAALVAEKRSNEILTLRATVKKVLADDREGSPHQRFLLALPSGATVLVAHNIELAPRVDKLAAGDTVTVHGEYEWNERGGVIHWTHHDPAGRHEGGWIEHAGRRYE